MAVEKTIIIKADTTQAIKGVDSLTDSVENLGNESQDVSKQNQDAIKKTGDTAKKQTKVVKGLGTAIKGVGTALKAIGIGLVIALVAKLTEVFSQNQKVVDTLSTVMTTISIVFNQVFDAISNAYESAKQATGGFDALGKVLSGLVTIALTPLKLAFFGIVLGVQQAQLAWEKSFFGDKDPETIKSLNVAILETKKNLAEVALEAVEAGTDIVDNFVEAVTEVGELGSAVIENVKEVSVTSAIEQAEAITQARKNFELLALQQQRLQLQYQRDAELLRQIRDDDQKSIEERIQANKELGETLKLQGEAEAETIKQRIASLQAEQNALGVTQERTNEIYQLNTDLIDLQERLAGQESEQLTNKNALLREQIELSQTLTDGEKDRRLAQLEFEESQATTEEEKIAKQREQLELENQLILEDIERKRALYKEGTQARIDAENEYLSEAQRLANEEVAINNKVAKQKKTEDESVETNKRELLGGTLDILSGLAKEGSLLSKGIAVAQASINTFQGVTKALAETTDPTPTQSLRFANAIAVGVAGLANVKKILSTQPVSKNAPSLSGQGQAPTQQAPSFNLVQGTGTNQIAESIGEQQPLEAFVVSSNVTTGQSLDRNIIDNATI